MTTEQPTRPVNSYFEVRYNVIYECMKFNQLPGESAKDYIMTLHKMADKCKFGEMRMQLRLIVGIRNRVLSEQLQLDSEFTLKMVVKKIR